MKFLNIGPLELIFILIIAFIILGPNEAVNTARKIGGWVRRIMRSPEWSSIVNTSKEFRDLPGKIIQEAGLEESVKDIQENAAAISKELNQNIDVSEKVIEQTDSEDSINEIKNNLNEITTEVNKDIDMSSKP